MTLTSEFRFAKEDVVIPQVVMERKLGVPKIVVDGDACGGFADLLGVLNGHKTVAMVHVDVVLPDKLPDSAADSAAACAGRAVTDWDAWKKRLLQACAERDVCYWRVRGVPSDVLVFRRTNLRFAALAYACLDEELFRDMLPSSTSSSNLPHVKSIVHCIAGRLFGYDPVDIEAWYLGRALSTFLLEDLFGSGRSPEWLRQRVSGSLLKQFHKSFLVLLEKADSIGVAIMQNQKKLQSDVFERLMSDIRAEMARVGA